MTSHTIKILIVEDNPQSRYLMKTLLSSAGYEVLEAHDGAEALTLARQSPPDMVISDIMMPVMDGYALCRAWQVDSELPATPFVFYSATYTEEEDLSFAYSLGADHFWIKPLENNDLLSKIAACLADEGSGKHMKVQNAINTGEYYLRYNARLTNKLEQTRNALKHSREVFQIQNNKLRDELDELAESQSLASLALTPATELAQRTKDLERQTFTDPLTEIFNRRYFDQHLDLEWRRASRFGARIALLMIDIDYFKDYNDHFGHPTGDRILRQVAKTIQSQLKRAGEFVARYGGEEFVVLAPMLDHSEAVSLAESIQLALADENIEHPSSQAGDILSLSIGVTTEIASDPLSASLLLKHADEALYQAKAEGRNCISEWIPHNGTLPPNLEQEQGQ